MEIGLITAFIGGMLAILSPCGALLLPAFFASTVGTGPKLLMHGAVFFLGLLLVLVPLGIGAGALGALFIAHRTIVIIVASTVLIVFGTLQIFGVGFDAAKVLPGGRQLQRQASTRVGLVKTVLLGAASGVAGFCAGPILGAVLTLAAAQGNIVLAGTLLAVYGAGMVVPLVVLAAVWGRISDRSRRTLRGRAFTVFGRTFHSTSVITGLLMISIGVLFWATNGLVSMPQIVPTSVLAWLQSSGGLFANIYVDIGAIIAVAVLILVLWYRSQKQRTLKDS